MGNCLLYLCSLLFGLGSWVAITGLWLETPLLIHYLPERWALSSYLVGNGPDLELRTQNSNNLSKTVFRFPLKTFSIQLANIVVLIYWYLNYRFPRYCNEVSGTNSQLLVGAIASVMLIFYWDTRVEILGRPRSIVLFVCAFLLSIVDCLSSVTFLPFMARFDSRFLTPYLIGEGLSSFLVNRFLEKI